MHVKAKSLLLFFCFLISGNIFSQEMVNNITNRYYRSNPFNGKFSDFVKDLITDPSILNKTISKRTNSTLFFFYGEYAVHNPFTFKSIRTEIRLAEVEEAIFEGSELTDTVIFYQLSAYADNSKDGGNAVKMQLNTFFRDSRSSFNNTTSKKIKDNNRTIGDIYNFTPKLAAKAAVVASWMIINEKESVFSITLRLLVDDDEAHTTQVYHPARLPGYDDDF